VAARSSLAGLGPACLALAALPACAALDWLAQPVYASPEPIQTEPPPQPSQAPTDGQRPTSGSCSCCLAPGASQEVLGPAQPQAPQGGPAEPVPAPTPGPARGAVIIRAVGGAAGALTGNPVGYTVLAQLGAALFSAAASRRRRPTPTGEPAPK
jgi:hypothetical protein